MLYLGHFALHIYQRIFLGFPSCLICINRKIESLPLISHSILVFTNTKPTLHYVMSIEGLIAQNKRDSCYRCNENISLYKEIF